MTTMIEKVARAIWERTVGHTRISWDQLDPLDQDVFRAYARAAIEAMREPTERMENAAVDAAIPLGYIMDEGETNAIWTAMLDAALKD